MFGVGSQTYTDQIPMNAKTPTGKPKIAWRQAPGLGETLINKVTGKQVSDIPKEQWGPLVQKKQEDALTAIEMQKVKATVMETGQPQSFNNKLIYMDNGILKTKDLKPKTTTEKEATGKKAATKKVSVKKPKKITLKEFKPAKISTSTFEAPQVKKISLNLKNKLLLGFSTKIRRAKAQQHKT